MRVKCESSCKFIADFERELSRRVGVFDLKIETISTLIGCAKSTMVMYRKGTRTLPKYHKKHMTVLLMLSDDDLKRMIEND